MNAMFILAGLLALLIGLVHSIMGEILIFRRLRSGGWIPTDGGQVLRESHVRIIWATWHVLSVFGWVLAAILFRLAVPTAELGVFIKNAVLLAMAIASLLVLMGTRGRHPGWVGLLGVAVLLWFG
ncbi:MAG: hypothetical protein QNJ45_03325 [Ardenticatenaceae bacterium]|nr:hypothetical protein [Ardenticatenaceae bacterium]